MFNPYPILPNWESILQGEKQRSIQKIHEMDYNHVKFVVTKNQLQMYNIEKSKEIKFEKQGIELYTINIRCI